MIRKILSPVNQVITHVQDWADEKLRRLCGRMTPEIRLAVILLLFLFFGGLSIYFTVSSIYRIGKEDGETIRIEHIRQLQLQSKDTRICGGSLGRPYLQDGLLKDARLS